MKFQNPSLNFFLNGLKDERTHKAKPICSPLFQSWGHKNCPLTHISLVSFLLDIVEQNRPRCEAAKLGVPSGAILFADMNFIEK